MGEDQALPDEFRCNRNDGRDWRCKRRVMEGKKLCEIHYVQGRLRQSKENVPESLKFKRGENRKAVKIEEEPPDGEESVAIRANSRREKLAEKKRERGTEILERTSFSDRGMKKMKTELIRMFVKREIRRSKKKRGKKAVDFIEELQHCEREVTRDLPYGLMEISPAPASKAQSSDNAGSVGAKLGLHCSNSVGNRRYRSKNIAPPPIGAVKVVPYVGNFGKVRNGTRKCRLCRKSDSHSSFKCSSCKKPFCSDSIKKRFIDEQEVELVCPLCRGTCNCKTCSTTRLTDVDSKEILKDRCKVTKLISLHYLISLLLPILKQINQEQSIELEIEAKFKGKNLSEVEIQQADIGSEKQCIICNNCSSPILNFHRTCTRCSYNLCLGCCQVFRRGSSGGSVETPLVKNPRMIKPCLSNRNSERKQISRSLQKISGTNLSSSSSLSNMESCNGCISCPQMEIGGCDNSLVELRCLFPLNLTEELERNAREIVSSKETVKTQGDSLHCYMCFDLSYETCRDKELLEAARRKKSGDNFLYRPNADEDHDILLIHFQKHWRNGYPVIVRSILNGSSKLSWDPVAVFCSYLERKFANGENEKEAGEGARCLDWYEVEFGSTVSFTGSLGKAQMHLQRETLKLKANLSSALSQQVFKDHYAEIINALPLQEYTNPKSALLNLAANLPVDFPEPKLGPWIHITCSSHEELERGDSVTNLYYSSYDVINILAHATDAAYTTEQLNKMKAFLRRNARDEREYNAHDLENGLILEHSEITEEAEQHDRIMEMTQLCSMSNLKDCDTLPTKVHGSDTDSDASMVCCQTSESCERSMDQICSDHMKRSCCGSEWDVFRREDVPKLLEYIRRHSNDFRGSKKQDVHPILDRRLFLDDYHKRRLKEEFKIEPWTFNQHFGEAVIIPAGCPYQMRNLKCCVHVVMGFLSPENALECVKLSDKLRILPNDHKAKKEKLEVEKMAIHSLSEAIKEISKACMK
ncbi:hypothetical protein Nepgr_032159 [Nepenthes gracilis]|uniref:Lysine-specific demethylase JMJ25 n=1 Tax=Nepenthes gracilis TaxID=150966 RepID=A0AAD3Y827_NEPGR|nr:hypothetical protein Nepgr_032159 [Nepenthes gracilis]